MNNIKKKREDTKLTQSVLAFMLGVDRSMVAKWESGEVNPRADKLLELAKALGCSIEELFKEEKKEG